ncbi:MAG TPA: hypothetical protein VK338_03095 [Candidatus Nitrosocosmicus sp.]|nr:hypothetical protein [Candidatus Nitrosocosmicus sp.]
MEIKDMLIIGVLTTIIIGPLWYYFEVIRVSKTEKKPLIDLPTQYASSKKVNVIGIYTVPKNKDVHLIELMVNASLKEFDMVDFTQEDLTQPRDNWQVAYDEQYLNRDGTEVIQDSNNKSTTRVAFFMYYLNFSKPLITPFGLIDLPKPTVLPKRLTDIINLQEATN